MLEFTLTIVYVKRNSFFWKLVLVDIDILVKLCISVRIMFFFFMVSDTPIYQGSAGKVHQSRLKLIGARSKLPILAPYILKSRLVTPLPLWAGSEVHIHDVWSELIIWQPNPRATRGTSTNATCGSFAREVAPRHLYGHVILVRGDDSTSPPRPSGIMSLDFSSLFGGIGAFI